MTTGRLLSVNVGGPREVAWQGKTVRTAIWKQPVDGPRMVRRINIDGDDQADRLAHGGEHRAVFVYQIESYRYWERELGRNDFTYGQFGENLTVEGLADDEVCVGDRYRIGAALFEVTQPRVTCYRVGIRMDDPAMPSLLVAHHRPGFYLRVLEEGSVQAGDAIVKVADGPERLTIAQVDALLYLPDKSREMLERALRVPALSEGWKGSFRELLAKVGADAAAAPAWSGFRPLRVAEVRRESATITSFRLVPTENAGSTPRVAAGQYLTVRVQPSADAPPLTRSYSLSDVPGERGYRISVKREGAASLYLHQSVKVGDVLDVAAPRGSFVLRDGARPVVLISGGVGATPVLAMLHALAREHSPRPVWWIHGARNRDEHAFGAEADALLGALSDGHRVLAYSQPGVAEKLGSDYDVSGRLDLAALDRAGVPTDADYYLCGPEGFMRAIGAMLTARGVEPDRVATEAFGAVAVYASGIVKAGERAPHPPDGPPGTGPTVSFVRSSVAIPWDDRYPSLLDLAEACDVPVGFGCRHGCAITARAAWSRRRHLRHGAPRAAARRPGPRLLQQAGVRARAGPLTRPTRATCARSASVRDASFTFSQQEGHVRPMAKQPRIIVGQVAAVTGAARGIGKATAQAFVREGMKVAIGDLDQELAEAAAAELGPNAAGFELDVTRRDSFEAFVDAAEERFGPLDVLVNNAGIMPLGRFLDEDDATARRMIDINLHGVIHGMKIALPRMMARNRGHVVNIASQAGKYGAPGGATYSATKHAVIGLTEAVRGELHIEASAVELSYVMPFVVKTELGGGTQNARGMKKLEPEEVADAIVDAIKRGVVDVWLPRSSRHTHRLGALLPRRVTERLTRAMKADRVLMGADHQARAAYELRAAHSEPGLEPGEEQRQLTS